MPSHSQSSPISTSLQKRLLEYDSKNQSPVKRNDDSPSENKKSWKHWRPFSTLRNPSKLRNLRRDIDFKGHHLLSVADLDRNTIANVLDRAAEFTEFNRSRQKSALLDGLIVVNAFFEPSTRTQVSFQFAAYRLGAHVINFDPDQSSVAKGESIIDTARTINAMRPDVLIVRHALPGTAREITKHVMCCVINAGDGSNEHPTQALVDALTIRHFKGRLEGREVAICGDIRHSRVAKSNVLLLQMFGASVRLIAPEQLLPDPDEFGGVQVFTDMDEGIRDVDVVMMLRMQRERMGERLLNSFNVDYHAMFGLTRERLEHAAPDAIVMHPGPINRGMEIDDDIADDPDRSVILDQVEFGVAVRMACLDLLTRERRAEA